MTTESFDSVTDPTIVEVQPGRPRHKLALIGGLATVGATVGAAVLILTAFSGSSGGAVAPAGGSPSTSVAKSVTTSPAAVSSTSAGPTGSQPSGGLSPCPSDGSYHPAVCTTKANGATVTIASDSRTAAARPTKP